MDTNDWQRKAELVSYFSNSRDILALLRENPITSGISEMQRYGVMNAKARRAFQGLLGDKAPTFLLNTRLGLKKVSSNPVAAVEAFENGLDLLASLDKGQARGMSTDTNIKEAIGNILDFNYRGGADAPGLVKDKTSRNLVQFVQTPMKLAETKAKLIMMALRGGKDVYGTDNTANLVKHIVAIGVARGVGIALGINVMDSILHLPFFNADQWSRLFKMGYYGSKYKLGLGGYADKQKFGKAQKGFIGDDRGMFIGSPLFGIGKDVNTLVSEGPKAVMQQAPAWQQMKAILTQKTPKGFDNLWGYITNQRTEQSKKKIEQSLIKKGGRQMMYEKKKATRNEWDGK